MNELCSEIVKIVKEAMRLEIKGRNFFLHAAEVTGNALGKKMFEMLANEEIGHMKAFGELFSVSTGSDEWKKHVKTEEKETSAVIEHLKTRVKNEEREKGSGDLEALRIGMELERTAIDFFSGMVQDSTSATAREIAEKICGEEKNHYDLLQAQYDSLNNSGFWLDSAEFRLDGEY